MIVGRFSSLVFLFFSIYHVYGLKCGSGGMCYGYGSKPNPFDLAPKECPDACVSFKCFVQESEIMEGAGCYEDFVNACKYTRNEIKDQIKANLKNATVTDNSINFNSCDDSDGCATNGINGSWIMSNTSEDFGFLFKRDPELPCKYKADPKQNLPAKVQCKTMVSCVSGKDFNPAPQTLEKVIGPEQTCDACVKFTCTPDGKTVTTGYGCYEDFVNACKFLDDGVKGKIKENIKDSLYFNKKYSVFGCSDQDNCHQWSYGLLYYFQVNKGAKTLLEYDSLSDKTCEGATTTPGTSPPPSTREPPSTSSTAEPPSASPTAKPAVSTTPEKKTNDQSDADDVFTTTLEDGPVGAANSVGCLMLLLLGLNFIV